MRVVDPAVPAATGRTRTLTARLVALRPSMPDLIDGGFLICLVMLAMLGFATTFDSPRYLVVALVGVVLGVLAAHLANVLRWHWLTVIVLAAVTYFLLGGALALQDDVIAGVIPSVATLTGLSEMTVHGWKDMLTTLPPIAGDGPYVALPYLMAVLAGTVGFAVARRSRRVWPPLVTPAVLLGAVILLGTLQPAAPQAQGLGFAALAFGWLAVRWHRRLRLTGTGTANLTRVLSGVGLLVVAITGAVGFEGLFPLTGGTPRLVLRSYVEPPLDLTPYTSPLVGFRKYSGKTLARSYYDQELLKVEAGDGLKYLRLAVLDDYSGQTWSGTGGSSAGPDTGFQRVGSQVPQTLPGEAVDTTVTVLPAYADNRDLSPWLPSLGQALSVSFEGPRARDHGRSFRFNLSTSQGLVPDRLGNGDVIRSRVVPLATITAEDETPGGSPVIDGASYQFLVSSVPKLTGGKGDAWGLLRQAMKTLREEGSYSDGTLPGETDLYRPGHGQLRLTTFLGSDQLVGSDEQYAAALGLVATQLGFPARVVFGAIVEGPGLVKGKDVRAWVEIKVGDGTWKTIPPQDFIPPVTKHPQRVPPETVKDVAPVVVPPPNPVRPPASFESMFDNDARMTQTGNPILDQILRIVGVVLRWVGPPLLLIGAFIALVLGIKGRRRHRRRTRGAPTTRIAGGWSEVLDQARDLGHAVPDQATRREQTLALGRAEVITLAAEADRLVFGQGDPAPTDAENFWGHVRQVRRELTASLGFWRRWRVRLSLRSLLPNAALVEQASQRVATSVRSAVSRLRTAPARRAG